MTTTEAQGTCQAVDENMSDIIDGVAENALFDHLATCERCRDARYDAEQAIVRLSDASGDYHFPADLEQRVFRALAAGRAPSMRPSERLKQRLTEGLKERLSEKPRALLASLARLSVPARAPADAPSPPPPPAPKSRAHVTTDGRSLSMRWAWLSLAAAVGCGVLWLSSRRDANAPALLAAPRPSGAWQGEVLRVERAFGSPSGLSECARGSQVCHPLAPGDVAHVGMRLETDGLTRALVRFADGSQLALDRQSRFELDPNEARRGRLLEGNLVVEVERQGEPRAGEPASHAIIDVPLGRAEVLGTKFSLRTTDESTRVEVSRGSVRLIDARDEATTVEAGEAGVLAAGRAPKLEGVADLGRAFAWSSTAFEAAPGEAARGALGELTAKRPSDGQERPGAVQLAQHHVKVRIVDNVARTEVEEVFENGSDEVLEGIYRFPLPPGAQIERLALEVDGKLVEGAFVDREKAAAIWRGALVNSGGKKPAPSEDIVWVPGPWRDPALLEWQRGSRFELRIFPIEKRASRRIVIAYTEILPPSEGERTYTYPLPSDPRGSTRIGRFTAEVWVRGHSAARGVEARGYPMQTLSSAPEVTRLAFDANDFAPSGDLRVAYELNNADAELRAWAYLPSRAQHDRPTSERRARQRRLPEPEARPVGTVPSSVEGPDPNVSAWFDDAGVAADAGYVALALRPSLPELARDEPRDYVLVADSSRSMLGESYRRAVLVITHIVREMDRSDRVKVIACDASCQEWPGGYTRPGGLAADAAARFLDGIEPEGASDLGFAVEWAATLRERDAERSAGAPRRLRVIYVGDGTPTVGPIHPALIERAVTEALPLGGTLSAVAIGNLADAGALHVATRAGGGVSVAFNPGRRADEVALEVLGASYGRSLQNARLELPEGLVRVMPKRLGSVAAGAEALIVARLTRPHIEGHVVLRGEVAGEAFEQRYPLELTAQPGEANGFVPRLYASVAIAELEASMDEGARRRSIELSTHFNVASRYTSLLVLESPAMFSAFGLDNQRAAPDWSGELDSQKSESESESEMPAAPAEERVWEPAPSSGAREGSAARKRAASLGAGRDENGERPFARAPAPEPADPDAPNGPDTDGEAPERLRQQPLELEQQSPRWIPMRRIWERAGQIEVPPALLPLALPARREALEQRAKDNVESRDALRSLYVSQLLGGDLPAATRSAERWSQKDPLDVDALTARADLAAQRGERDLAIRILGSVVDVRPGDYKAQWRLARLHRWAGRAERGCRHSLAVAQLMLSNAKLATEAIGCAREVGQHRTADTLLAALEPSVRREVERQIQKKRPSDALSGDFRVQASWQGSDHDVDVVILDPDGYRVSWLGAPTRSVITASDVLSVHREGLGLRGAVPGRYAIELVRASLGRGAVHGNVVVSVANAERTLPFVLDGERARLCTVTLRNEAKLVPLDAWE